jgi:hypothetical protein
VSESPVSPRGDGSPVRLRVESFEGLANALGLKTGQARQEALGISQAQYWKVRHGAPAGAKFIDACLRVFGGRYYEALFERIEAVEEQPAEVSS